MNDFAVRMQQDCFGGGRIIDIDCPRAVQRNDLARVAGQASCTIIEGLKRPFYRVDVPGLMLVSGVLEDRRVRFTIRLRQTEDATSLALQAARQMLGVA